MPQVCLACSHPKRSEIDTALLESTPNRRIARDFGLNETSIRRHRRLHLFPTLLGAANATQKLHAQSPVDAVLAEARKPFDLYERVEHLHSQAQDLLAEARRDGKYGPAVQAVRECTRLAELWAKVEGTLQTGTNVSVTQVNVTASPEWITLRRVVLEAVWPFPQARAALGQALAGLEESNIDFDQAPKSPGQGPVISPDLPRSEPE